MDLSFQSVQSAPKRRFSVLDDAADDGNVESEEKRQKSEVFLTLHRKIGEGTYGKVYQARFVDQGNWKAMKLLKQRCFNDDMPSIIRELLVGGTCSGVQRTGVIRIIENNTYGIIGDLGHCTLTAILDDGVVPLHAVRILGKRLLEKIVYMHEQGAMHRDLKPDNIILKWRSDDVWPEVHIIDYGLSVPVEKSKEADVVTLWWRAPEVLLGLEHTKAIDVWSFGVMIANMCAEQHITRAKDEAGVLNDVWEKMGFPTQEQWSCPRPKWKGPPATGFNIDTSHAQVLEILTASLVPNPQSRLKSSEINEMSFWKQHSTEEDVKSAENWISLQRETCAYEPSEKDKTCLRAAYQNADILYVDSLEKTFADADAFYIQNALKTLCSDDLKLIKTISSSLNWPEEARTLCVLIFDRAFCSGVFPTISRKNLICSAVYVTACLYAENEPSPRHLSSFCSDDALQRASSIISIENGVHVILRSMGFRLISKTIISYVKSLEKWGEIGETLK